jgi:hypothetical protein
MLLAIDPGLSGGLAVHRPDAGASAFPMPPTEGDVVDTLRSLLVEGVTHAWVENVPWVTGGKVSPASTGKLQRNVGVLHGALLALGIPHTLVAPQDWQKPLFVGLPLGLTTKDHAYLALHSRWPDLTFRESRRARTPHEGICDAACIGYYGSLQLPPQADGVHP